LDIRIGLIGGVLGQLNRLAGVQIIGIDVPVAVAVVLPDHRLSVRGGIDLIAGIAGQGNGLASRLPHPDIPASLLVVLIDGDVSPRPLINAVGRKVWGDLLLVERSHIDHPSEGTDRPSKIRQVILAQGYGCGSLQAVGQLGGVFYGDIERPDGPVVLDLVLV